MTFQTFFYHVCLDVASEYVRIDRYFLLQVCRLVKFLLVMLEFYILNLNKKFLINPSSLTFSIILAVSDHNWLV